MKSSFDVIVFGASGFTGGLVAEVLAGADPVTSPVRWAMAGRDLGKLAGVRKRIGAPASLPLLAADASDPASLAALARASHVVISTVGPYQHHGSALVAACAVAGTDYVDLCGEPPWMAQMIPRLQAPARHSGARIVFSCGFDSIPFDLGVVFLQAAAMQRFGVPLQRVLGGVAEMKGGPSGGTIASALATVEQMQRDPEVARLMADPFALTPGFRGPPQPGQRDAMAAVRDELAGGWTAPFVMAPINTKNVHRTNLLRGHPWGADFEYDERMLAGSGPAGERRARRLARRERLQAALLGFAPGRALLRRFVLPRPGEGPGPRERARGRYRIVFSGRTADGRVLRATVSGDRDPGYGSTSRMVVQAALCLAHDLDRRATPGGVWTPGAALGLALVRRLQAHAGLRFEIEPDAG